MLSNLVMQLTLTQSRAITRTPWPKPTNANPESPNPTQSFSTTGSNLLEIELPSIKYQSIRNSIIFNQLTDAVKWGHVDWCECRLVRRPSDILCDTAKLCTWTPKDNVETNRSLRSPRWRHKSTAKQPIVRQTSKYKSDPATKEGHTHSRLTIHVTVVVIKKGKTDRYTSKISWILYSAFKRSTAVAAYFWAFSLNLK